ncbi:hypothetical protein [Proteiniborus sp. MB09-C3]|uniref:hypothetical protein n=1 Tax=Proteiniborus sp. MB09-C3 TaxID=3050072 RepID=UPI002552556B|nr:hypothetical protein [Proteiniborus sp. MB09-C3]WIV10764.1 hypothetical protein QO263_11405 [Proteiniborus sp. MB09-C3]
MKNFNFNYSDHSFLKDINNQDLLKLKEMGLNDRELASELGIPKSHLTQLYREYDVELQGD